MSVRGALKKSILHRKNSSVLQESEGGPDGRPVHEPDSHLRVKRRRPVRLSEPSCSGTLEELRQTPSEWMPWNYRETLARTGALLDAA